MNLTHLSAAKFKITSLKRIGLIFAIKAYVEFLPISATKTVRLTISGIYVKYLPNTFAVIA
jgi:hypothetical protein